jgi:hypothetical protein
MTRRIEPAEMGRRAEGLFARLAQRRGWLVVPAPRDADIREHWDFELNKDGRKLKVEVKALKRSARRDDQMNEEWVWIEFRNVRGEIGWLFGKADWIAFETEASFVIVKRLDLYELVRKIVDRTTKAETTEEAKYKTYTRKGRADEITQIQLADILKIKMDEWAKEE